jgi:hypothetical protein
MRSYDFIRIHVPSEHSHDILRVGETQLNKNENCCVAWVHRRSFSLCLSWSVWIPNFLQQARRANEVEYTYSRLWI